MADKKKENKKEKRIPNIAADFTFVFPNEEEISCTDCMFREKDNGKVKGAILGRCACFPRNDKPTDILFKGAECEYYVPDDIK